MVSSLSETDPGVSNLGCWKDTRDRAVPVLYASFRFQLNWDRIEHSVEQCLRVAKAMNMKYFAVQFYGECWGTHENNHNAPADYQKHGSKNNCFKNKVGMRWSFVMYQINF